MSPGLGADHVAETASVSGSAEKNGIVIDGVTKVPTLAARSRIVDPLEERGLFHMIRDMKRGSGGPDRKAKNEGL